MKSRRIYEGRMNNYVVRLSSLCVVSSLLLVGCSSPRPESPSSTALTEVTPATAYAVPSSGLDGLVDAAMRHHPAIAAAEAKVERMKAMIPQAEALPDPMVKATGGRLAETAAGRVDATLGAEQRLPFPGKRRAAGAVAGAEVKAAQAELENIRLTIAAQLRTVYWNYYLTSKSIDVLEQSGEVLADLRNSVDIRVRAGKASQQDLLRVVNSISDLERRLITAHQQRESAVARLNSMLHRPPDSSLPEARWSTAEISIPDAEVMSHPEIEAAKSRVAMFEARMKKARLDRFPDFTVGLQYGAVSESGMAMSANGRDQYGATVGVNIPLWRAKLDAAEREAQAGMAESRNTLAAVRNDLSYRLADARARVASAQRIVKLFDESILPDSQQAYELSLKEYSADTAGFLDVIDAWRQTLNYQLQQEENRAALGTAMAAYRLAAGEP